jgi:DNA replication protein DnaC
MSGGRIVVTMNLAFAEWVTVFAGDEKLTTALLDRFAHHATVIATKGRAIACGSAAAASRSNDPSTRLGPR